MALLALTALLGEVALATPSPSLGSQQREPDSVRFDETDFAWSLLAAEAGLAAGGLVGALVGGLAEQCDPYDGLNCNMLDTTESIGIAVGGSLGAAAGIYAYGELSGHDGSFAATVAGASIGTLVASLIGLAVDDDGGGTVFMLTMLTLPAIGGTLGYGWTCDSGPDAKPPTSAALLDYAPERGLQLSVPALGVARSQTGELTVHVPLAGGTF